MERTIPTDIVNEILRYSSNSNRELFASLLTWWINVNLEYGPVDEINKVLIPIFNGIRDRYNLRTQINEEDLTINLEPDIISDEILINLINLIIKDIEMNLYFRHIVDELGELNRRLSISHFKYRVIFYGDNGYLLEKVY